MSHWRDLLMLNKLRAPVGNMRIFIRIRIRILHVFQSADPHFTRSLALLTSLVVSWIRFYTAGLDSKFLYSIMYHSIMQK